MRSIMSFFSVFRRSVEAFPRVLQPFRNYAQLLRPKKSKYRKMQKNIRAVLPAVPEGPIPKPELKFGDYGMYALESIRLTAAQLESARMTLVKAIGRKGLKVWLRVFPHIPVSRKPLEVRMGKGKGAVDHFVSYVKAGRLLLEYSCPAQNTAKMGFSAAAYKLPIRVAYVEKQQTEIEPKRTDVQL